MKKQLQINIPNPCSENWDAMLTADQERFCNACEKVVTDFTGMTDKEIIRFFEQHKQEHICGRYLKSQVGRDIIYENSFSQKLQLSISKKIAASILLIQSISNQTFAQKVKSGFDNVVINKKHTQNNTINITGYVLDDQTNIGIPNISVRIAKTNLHTVTDTNGRFSIFVPQHIVNGFKELDFIPAFINNEDSGTLIGISINQNSFSKPVLIYRHLPQTVIYSEGGKACLTGDVIITPVKKKHWFGLFKKKNPQ